MFGDYSTKPTEHWKPIAHSKLPPTDQGGVSVNLERTLDI